MKEQLALLVTLGLVVGTTSLQAFTERQRRAIKERDGCRCNAPFCHKCNPEKLEVHHILGQRYMYRQGVDPDYPENAITICSNAHDTIHPDRVEAREAYRAGDKDAFRRLGEERDKKLDRRQITWNDEHDRKMQVVAVRNTQKAQEKGWVFPTRKRRTR